MTNDAPPLFPSELNYPRGIQHQIKASKRQIELQRRLPTSSSLSDVSESVDAAAAVVGLLTGSSCSSESVLFRLAKDSSSWRSRAEKKKKKDNDYRPGRKQPQKALTKNKTEPEGVGKA